MKQISIQFVFRMTERKTCKKKKNPNYNRILYIIII